MGKTILAAGDQYDLAKLKQERERIDAALKEKGYFYFSPDFIVFQADSTAGNRRVNLSLLVKKDIPVEATRVYTIGDIYIYSDYSLNRDSVAIPAGVRPLSAAATTLTSIRCSILPLLSVRFSVKEGPSTARTITISH